MVKKVLIGLAALTLVGCAVSPEAYGFIAAEGSNYSVLDDDTFEATYEINEQIVVPSIDNLYFETGSGLTKVTYGEIVFPDGVARIPGKYILNIPGIYKVAYYGANGASFKKEFIVNKYIYENGKGVESHYYDKLPFSGKSGVEINLISGSSFKLNKVVNIHDFKNQIVDVGEFYPEFRDNKDGIPAASFCTVKLVDAYDSSKFLEFYMWCDKSAMPYYAGVGSSEQNFTGLEYNPNRPDKINCVFEGVSYNKHVTTRYQVVDAYGVWGPSNDNATLKRDNGMAFLWNLNNNQAWFTGAFSKLITDLDAPEVYDSNPLIIDEFFTTGEVYPQFECFAFNSPSMKLEVVDVLGLTGNDLKDAIVYDTKGPDIELGFETKEGGITVFKDEKFYLPTDVEVHDFNYYGDLKTNVYLNYGQPDQASVYSIDYFVPTELGQYSLVYSARDSYGNESKKVVSLNCVDRNPFEYTETKLSSLNAASVNEIPLLNVSGKNGAVHVEAFAIDPKGNRSVLGYNKDKTAFSFVPLYLGEYEIEYRISDDFYSSVFSYKLNSNDVGAIYFDKDPAVSPAYIKGASYSLDEFVGQKATAEGPIDVSTEASIAFDGGAFTKISDPKKFEITGNNSVKFKFSASGVEYVTDDIEITDVKFGERSTSKKYKNYFLGNFTDSTEETSSLRYVFGADGEMKFANIISFANFGFNYEYSNSSMKTIEVILSDYQNQSNYVSVLIEKVTSITYKATVSQFDGIKETNTSGYFNNSAETTDIVLALQGGKLYVNDYVSFEVAHSFELSKLSLITKGETTVDVKKINNQNLLKATKVIENGPEAYYAKKSGSFEMGSDFEIDRCIASCVLSPVLTDDIKLDVTDAAGEIVKSLDGVTLTGADANRNYEINLASCGQYKVNYIISVDGSNRTGADKIVNSKAYYIVNVDDTVAPVVKFDNNETLEIKVHDTIKIRSFSVSDNHSTKENIKTFVMVTDYNGTVLESGFKVETYTFHKEGTYVVKVFAYDEYGNYGTDSYNVVVRS